MAANELLFVCRGCHLEAVSFLTQICCFNQLKIQVYAFSMLLASLRNLEGIKSFKSKSQVQTEAQEFLFSKPK